MVEKLKEIDPDADRAKVIKKINIFRTNYKRDLKKFKKSEKSGAGTDDLFQSSLWYYEKLNFLEEQECSTLGKCTMDTESFNTETGDEEPKGPPSKKRKQNPEDNLLQMACEKLAKSDDDQTILSKGWATQYKDLTKAQQIFARTIFGDVLFHGCLEKITEKKVEDIHKILRGVSETPPTNTCQYISRTSTPYTDECSQSNSSSNLFSQPIQYTLAPGQTQQFIPILQNSLPIVTNQQILKPSPIAQFLNDFEDE